MSKVWIWDHNRSKFRQVDANRLYHSKFAPAGHRCMDIRGGKWGYFAWGETYQQAWLSATRIDRSGIQELREQATRLENQMYDRYGEPLVGEVIE